jgi:predicted metal-binding protein
MLNEAIRESPNVGGILIDPDDLVFEERVKMNCFYCGKFGSNWKCPPRLPDLDYKKMISEFDHAAFIYIKVPFTESNYHEVRAASSVSLHHVLLKFEKYLWDHNNSTSVSFLGGSCRLCKNGCSSEKCNNPYLARAPVEATGINVLKSIKKYGIDIIFPPKEVLFRIGLILW